MGVMHRPGARRDVGGAGALDAASQRGPHQKGSAAKAIRMRGRAMRGNLSTETAGCRRQGWYVMARLNAR
jgi:hypothetical protein